MKVLYLYCHPLPESFHAGIRAEALAALEKAGHEVDLFDLYAEGFDPVLSEEGRRNYHDTTRNRAGLEPAIERLMRAEGLVVQFPTWCFGFPAMLKGYFDRVFMPGVGFDISDPAHVEADARPHQACRGHLHLWPAALAGDLMADPPRKMVKRYFRWHVGPRARVEYHALYHMNVATLDQRTAFVGKVRSAMEKF